MELTTFVLLVAALGGVLFVVAFGILDPWWRTAFGVHIMAYSTVVTVILSLAVWHRLAGPVPQWVWLTLYVCLVAVIWQRLILLILTHYRDRS